MATEIERATAAVASDWDKLEIGCRTFLTASRGDDTRRVMLLDAPAVLGWEAWRTLDAAMSGRLLARASPPPSSRSLSPHPA